MILGKKNYHNHKLVMYELANGGAVAELSTPWSSGDTHRALSLDSVFKLLKHIFYFYCNLITFSPSLSLFKPSHILLPALIPIHGLFFLN